MKSRIASSMAHRVWGSIHPHQRAFKGSVVASTKGSVRGAYSEFGRTVTGFGPHNVCRTSLRRYSGAVRSKDLRRHRKPE